MFFTVRLGGKLTDVSSVSPLSEQTRQLYVLAKNIPEHCTGIAEVTGSNPAEA